MKYTLCAAMTLLLIPANFQFVRAAADAPEPAPLARASVTIPYTELQTLWTSAHPQKLMAAESDRPPIPYLVNEADGELTMGETSSKLVMKFQVETFGSEWSTVPLIAGAARLEKVEVGTAGAVVWRNGYSLLTHQPGRTQVLLQLSLPGWKAAAAGEAIAFKLSPAAIKRLKVAGVPAGLTASLNGALLSGNPGPISLGGETDQVSLALSAPQPQRREIPSNWRTEVQVLAQQQEGRLQITSRVFAHSEGGSGLALKLKLPVNASAVTLSGDDLADWSQSRTEGRELVAQVRFNTWDVLDRELAVTFTVPVSPLAEQWTIAAPVCPDDPDPHALYVIKLADGLELKTSGLRFGLEAGRLPEWMRTAISGASIATGEAGAELVVAPHWLPAVATSEATITTAKSELRYVADGSFQTAARYTVRHSASLSWPIELPAGVTLLSCTREGQPTRPVRRESGALELTLPGDGTSARDTEVVLVYTGKRGALDAVSGKLSLELVRTPLFIDRLEWVITIPEAFEITAAEGNAQIEAASAGERATTSRIALRKDLCRGEQPSVELFYQRRGLDQ